MTKSEKPKTDIYQPSPDFGLDGPSPFHENQSMPGEHMVVSAVDGGGSSGRYWGGASSNVHGGLTGMHPEGREYLGDNAHLGYRTPGLVPGTYCESTNPAGKYNRYPETTIPSETALPGLEQNYQSATTQNPHSSVRKDDYPVDPGKLRHLHPQPAYWIQSPASPPTAIATTNSPMSNTVPTSSGNRDDPGTRHGRMRKLAPVGAGFVGGVLTTKLGKKIRQQVKKTGKHVQKQRRKHRHGGSNNTSSSGSSDSSDSSSDSSNSTSSDSD